MPRPRIVIVCPATPESNNGNWRTAARWQRLLRNQARVRIVQHWPDADNPADDIMLALHARKSAAAMAAWHDRHGARGLGLVLTGTDLYPDITQDGVAMASLARASALVVLQEAALDALPLAHRPQARVILQSCPQRQTLPKTARELRVVVVGHLREEKNPQMLWRALRRLPADAGIRITHIGHALDPALAAQAQAAMRDCPHYHWRQGLAHAPTLRHIQHAHLLVHTSRSEGGAAVLSEAIRCGTPVLATRIAGNVGLLGEDYEGLVAPDDDAALAERLRQCRHEQPWGATGLLARWQAQCQARAHLFDPAVEAAALWAWVQHLRG